MRARAYVHAMRGKRCMLVATMAVVLLAGCQEKQEANGNTAGMAGAAGAAGAGDGVKMASILQVQAAENGIANPAATPGERTTLVDYLAKLKADMRRRKMEALRMREQVAAYRDAVQQTRDELVRYRHDIARIQVEIGKKREEIEKYRDEMKILRREIADLAATITKDRTQVSKVAAEALRMRTEMERLRTAVMQMRDDVLNTTASAQGQPMPATTQRGNALTTSTISRRKEAAQEKPSATGISLNKPAVRMRVVLPQQQQSGPKPATGKTRQGGRP